MATDEFWFGICGFGAGAMLMLAFCIGIIGPCDRQMQLERVRHEAAEAGAGQWTVDPVTGERSWEWKGK